MDAVVQKLNLLVSTLTNPLYFVKHEDSEVKPTSSLSLSHPANHGPSLRRMWVEPVLPQELKTPIQDIRYISEEENKSNYDDVNEANGDTMESIMNMQEQLENRMEDIKQDRR